jgi:hypothetical protein
VAIGYGERRARDVTGSVQTVSTEQFNTGRVVSPEQLIQAKVPGVQMVDSGEPGGGVNIRIRGGTSVNASNEPLFVVDGVPLAPRRRPVGGPQPAELPQPGRHREHHGAQGRRIDGDLRVARRERRGAGHHEDRPLSRSAVLVQRLASRRRAISRARTC